MIFISESNKAAIVQNGRRPILRTAMDIPFAEPTPAILRKKNVRRASYQSSWPDTANGIEKTYPSEPMISSVHGWDLVYQNGKVATCDKQEGMREHRSGGSERED